MLEILRKSNQAKKVLKSVYSYMVTVNNDNNENIKGKAKKPLIRKGKYIYYCAEILSLTDVKEVDNHHSKEIANAL